MGSGIGSTVTRTAINMGTSGIDYKSNGSIGWSNDKFRAGIKSTIVNGAISYGLDAFNVGGGGRLGAGLKAGITNFANSTLDFNEDGFKIGIRNDNNWGDRFAAGVAGGVASAITYRASGKEESAKDGNVGTGKTEFAGGISTDEYLGHLAYNSINSGLLSAYNMARYDMSWSEASTTTGFYSGMNYSVSELGGFAGSALVGYTKELIKKRETNKALQDMDYDTDAEGNPLSKDPLGIVENFLVGMYESMCGSFSRIKNGFSGNGFNTDAELTEQSKQLVEEYNKIKDMTLLAGVGDANMKSASEAAARKAEIENELAKKDPDALAKLRAESSEGKANAAGLKTAVDAAMKYYDGYDEAVSAAMKEFDKMNENGEMTAKFIEIKNDGQIIIKKNSSGESAVEYSFDKSGGMTGCKLYTNTDVSTAGVFDAMDTKNKKSLDYNTLNLYSDAAMILWKDTVGAKSYQSETGYAQNLIQNSIANAAVKMNKDTTIGKYGKEAGLSMLKQLVNDSGIKEFGKELWGQSSAGEKAVYIGVGSAVGLAVMNQLVETIYDSKKANAKEGEKTDASLKVDAGKFSVQMTKTDEEKFLEAEGKIKNYTGKVILSKDEQSVSGKYTTNSESFTAGFENNNKSYTASFEAEQSIIVDKNYINKVIVGLGFSNTINGANEGASAIPKVRIEGEIAGFHYDFGGQYKVTDKKKENNAGSFFFNLSKKIWKWN